MSYWVHNEDNDLCYKRKGGTLNSKRGVFTTSAISFALLRGEPAYYADGHHFEGVAVVDFSRRGDAWTMTRIREEETGETLYLEGAAVEAATKEAYVMLDAVLTGYREDCEQGNIYQGGEQ
jgi:hypothetical protein